MKLFLIYMMEKLNKEIIQKMKKLYDSSIKQMKMGVEGKKLYKYLLDNKTYEEKIINKITEQPLLKNEFEILLYSFRFIFNSQINDTQCFYNEILKKSSFDFIRNNFIPGSFPLINEFLKSYYILKEKLEQKLEMGYYICKDCGYLYEIKPSTFPLNEDRCPNGHIIGGKNHMCSKRDIRVFLTEKEYNEFFSNYQYFPSWINSFESNTLSQFKEKYVDKNNIEEIKGIINSYEINDFERNFDIRGINIITFRILNLILYSYILASYILENISQKEAKNYLVENLFPHTLFGIIKKNWELLDISLKQKGVDNIKIFMNLIFEKLKDFIVNLKSIKSYKELNAFETTVNKYIMTILSNKANIENINKNYKKINNELFIFKPNINEEIIIGNNEHNEYDQRIIQIYNILPYLKMKIMTLLLKNFNYVKKIKINML